MQSRAEIRNFYRKVRQTLPTEAQNKASLSALQIILKNNLFDHANTVATYLANDGELDPTPIIKYLWSVKKQVCLPVLHPFNSGSLLFLKYTADTKLIRNRFNILEPSLDVTQVVPIEQIDVVLTPLVAFDNKGNRLGMGGGFYDRSLAKISSNKKSKTQIIGLAHEQQKSPSIPAEEWDIALEKIVSSTQLYSFI